MLLKDLKNYYSNDAWAKQASFFPESDKAASGERTPARVGKKFYSTLMQQQVLAVMQEKFGTASPPIGGKTGRWLTKILRNNADKIGSAS